MLIYFTDPDPTATQWRRRNEFESFWGRGGRVVADGVRYACRKILTMPNMKQKLAEQGSYVFVSRPDQFNSQMKADLAMYGRIINDTKIKVE